MQVHKSTIISLTVVICWVAVGGCAHFKRSRSDGQFGASAPERRGWLAEKMRFSREVETPSDADESQFPKTQEEAEAKTLESQFAMARLSERRGDSGDAEKMYRSLIAKTPRDWRLHHRLGVMAIKKGDFARAEQLLVTAKSYAPANAELLSDIGYCYYLQQRLPEAEEVLREAIKLDSSYAAATNNLALVVGRQGRIKESLDLFKRVNNEGESYANLAYVMSLNGNVAEAKQMYLRALTLNNKMRAAAQAMLQVDDRMKKQQRMTAPVDAPDADATAPKEIAASPETKPKPADETDKIVLMLPPPPNEESNVPAKDSDAKPMERTVAETPAESPVREKADEQNAPAQIPSPLASETAPPIQRRQAEMPENTSDNEQPGAEVVIESCDKLENVLSQAVKTLERPDDSTARPQDLADSRRVQKVSLVESENPNQEFVAPGVNVAMPRSVMAEKEIIVESYPTEETDGSK